jgi:amidase
LELTMIFRRIKTINKSAFLKSAILSILCLLPCGVLLPEKSDASDNPGGEAIGQIAASGSYSIAEKSIAELSADLAAGRVTSEQLVETYLARIEKIDRRGAELRSVLTINPEAKVQARALDAERRAGKIRGSLHGIPILIKDNIETADPMPTTAGSLALKNNVTKRDAALAARLRAAGALILGKTNLSEWSNMRSGAALSGWSALGGLTRNPYALDRNASGSSTGSAVAVSADLAAAAIGTDTNGSITTPAAINGVVGFRPTLGLVSRRGVIPVGSSQDSPGPFARSVADTALVLSVIAGGDSADAATGNADARKVDYPAALRDDALKRRRLGVMRYGLKNYDRAVLELFEQSLAVLSAAGAEIVEINEFEISPELGRAAGMTVAAEFKSEINEYLASTPVESVKTRSLADLIAFNKAHGDAELAFFGQEYFEIAEASRGKYDSEYPEMRRRAKRLAGAEGVDKLLKTHRLDALIAPTTNPAWDLHLPNNRRGGEASVATLPAVAGYPHLSVPMGFVGDLPVGLSFIGTAWSDDKILAYGYAFGRRTKARRPPNFIRVLTGGDFNNSQ